MRGAAKTHRAVEAPAPTGHCRVFGRRGEWNSVRWEAGLDAEGAISVRELYSIQRVPRTGLKNTHTIKNEIRKDFHTKEPLSPPLTQGRKRLSLFAHK